MQEREISLVDLIVEILLRWRRFLIFMLCGAVLAGAAGYARTWRAYRAQEMQVQEEERQAQEEDRRKQEEELLEEEEKRQQEEELLAEKKQWAEDKRQEEKELMKDSDYPDNIVSGLTTLQRINVQNVLNNEEIYQEKLVYQDNSAILKMSPDRVYRGRITFLISSPNREQSYSIESVYRDVIAGGEIAKYMAERLDISEYLTELISVQDNLGNRMEGTDSFSVTVSYYDEQACQKMAQAVVEYIEDKHEELSRQLGEHDVKAVNTSLIEVYDVNVLNSQQSFDAGLVSLQNTIENAKTDFSYEEWRYYDFMTNGRLTGLAPTMIAQKELEEVKKEAEETRKAAEAAKQAEAAAKEAEGAAEALAEEEDTAPVKPEISMKYILLGMVLAAFLYAFVLFIVYVFNTKIRKTDDLQKLFLISQLGLIPEGQERKKVFGGIDRWLESLRERNKRRFDREEALGLAAVAVRMAAERNRISTVYLIGCDLKEQARAVCDYLRGILAESKIETVILNNVLYDAAAMSELDGAKGVVLVEKAGSTLYTEIDQELTLLKREEISVLGGIIVE